MGFLNWFFPWSRLDTGLRVEIVIWWLFVLSSFVWTYFKVYHRSKIR